MKYAKSNREEVRENVLTITVTMAEKDAIQKAADGMGLTMSAFSRIAIKKFLSTI